MIELTLAPAYPVELELTSSTGRVQINAAPSVTLALAALLGSGSVANGGVTFNQASPSTTWTINHNLGYRPSVTLLTVGGAEFDAEVIHTSVNQTVISLTAATAGSARLT